MLFCGSLGLSRGMCRPVCIWDQEPSCCSFLPRPAGWGWILPGGTRDRHRALLEPPRFCRELSTDCSGTAPCPRHRRFLLAQPGCDQGCSCFWRSQQPGGCSGDLTVFWGLSCFGDLAPSERCKGMSPLQQRVQNSLMKKSWFKRNKALVKRHLTFPFLKPQRHGAGEAQGGTDATPSTHRCPLG